MVAFTFDPVYGTLVVFLSALIPGVALGWPFLKKSELSVLEKLLLCFFIGLVVPPSLLIVEDIIGLKFSFSLVLINLLLVTAAGMIYGIREHAFSFALPAVNFDSVFSLEFAKKHAATALLLLAVFLSFWLRIQPYSPIYSELDPYYYVYGSGQIIRLGEAPGIEDTAWWPEAKMNHRGFTPLKMYIEAQWYSLYTSGAEYNNYLLFTISSWLPPISAALLTVGAYFLLATMYGKRYGILAAFLAAFLPVTIFKMSAGVNEAAPFGMASIFLVLGLYALALKKNDWRLGVISGLVFFATLLASNYGAVTAIPLAGFIFLQAAEYFARGKKNDSFLRISMWLVVGTIAGWLLYEIYLQGPTGIFNLPSSDKLLLIMAFVAAFLLSRADALAGFDVKKRQTALAVAALLALLVLLVPNPAGSYAKAQIKLFIGAADFNIPLQRTIAEQNVAGASFEGDGGFLAFTPETHAIASPKDAKDTAWNLIDALLGAIAMPFSAIGNASISLTGTIFNAFLGTNIENIPKTDSLLFVFIEIAAVGMVIEHFTRKGEVREEPSVGILVLLVILPILYIGLNKIKFTVFIGLALLMASVAAIALLEKFSRWLLQVAKIKSGERRIKYAFLAIIVLVICAQITIPSGYSIMILNKSFEPRYQDNPVAMMPKLANVCEKIRAIGYYDQEICDAGYNLTFADSMDGQFNAKVCLVSQLSLAELIPGQSAAEQQKSAEAKAGASFRCNRLAAYWVDSMEWIKTGTNASDRITSWWDYGHWINYFGDRKTVLRNEHASKGMIGRVAHDYIDGTPQQLTDSMNYFDSRYVLFDVELIGGDAFGGKYGALNYLSCAHDNRTSVLDSPGTSDCEFEHSPERLVISQTQTPGNLCTISESQQRTGVYAYRLTKTGAPESQPSYCVGGDITLATGSAITPTYYLDRHNSNGDLELNKGFLRQIGSQSTYSVFEVVYNSDPIWPAANGTYVGGMEDAKTKFYTSNLYSGFYLGTLPGFDLVYKSKGGEVKIYRMQNFTGNKEGYVDPVSAAKIQ